MTSERKNLAGCAKALKPIPIRMFQKFGPFPVTSRTVNLAHWLARNRRSPE